MATFQQQVNALASDFELRNQLSVGASTDISKDIHGEEYDEVALTRRPSREDVLVGMAFALDAYVSIWRFSHHKSPHTVHWRLRPEISQSECLPYEWRGYARLSLK